MNDHDYLFSNNLEYLEKEYKKFLDNPESISKNWRAFFQGVDFAHKISPPKDSSYFFLEKLVEAYRSYGHIHADLNPLEKKEASFPFLLEDYELSLEDLDKTFSFKKKDQSLKEILEFLKKTYCGTLTGQFSHCEPEVRDWFLKELEEKEFSFSKEKKRKIYDFLAKAESLETFIHRKYVGAKRFSIEGGDALLPMLEHLSEVGVSLGVEEIVMGMAHRGRINVLANFMEKSLDLIFAEFEGVGIKDTDYDGDVKYHMGYSSDKNYPQGSCHISLSFNPSHLESVCPVVSGMTRAKQRLREDTEMRSKVLPVLIHGDAAVIGQGVVSETFQLSQLEGYTVGGSVHVIVNNQVGFTTDPEEGRSTRYSSDGAFSIRAPILLVNADDVEACVRAMDMALRFRQEFHKDVVIELICYRRYGHNEGDEPSFTQPIMYSKIKDHPTAKNIYLKKLEKESLFSKKELEEIYENYLDSYQKVLEKVRSESPRLDVNSFEGTWKDLRPSKAEDFEKSVDTAIEASHLKELCERILEEPKDFHLHKKVEKLIKDRRQKIKEDKLDWALGELLAYASLRKEGYSVRLSGQDSKRGTFSHRHAVYFDTQTGKAHCPLSQIQKDRGEFCVYNSPLSELAVLGFEYGNSLSNPYFLTLWEAQFGDFSNGAQIIIDQFISSGENKWRRSSGLVLLLPHGYEGQGPEHSSCRIERFLQLCAQYNMQVCNLTSPANLFHVLRRQMKAPFRKPLVIATPKSLLRHPLVTSPLRDFSKGQFYEVFPEEKKGDIEKIENIVLCSGKVYYDLIKGKIEKNKTMEKTLILRLERLYPFPRYQLLPFLQTPSLLQRVIWLQEEPRNMGAWSFLKPHLEKTLQKINLDKLEVEYIGRKERASPAVDSYKTHEKEQKEIVESFLAIE